MAPAGKPEALQDVMLAMDIVDTLRHADKLVDRELDAAGRRDRLIERLRKIYQAQGIEVTDAVLREGVLALEEERFAYQRAGSGVSRWLARIYIARRRWFKPLAVLLIVALFIQIAIFSFTGAARQFGKPYDVTRLRQVYTELQSYADQGGQGYSFQNRAEAIYFRGTSAAEQGDASEVKAAVRELETLRDSVSSSYSLRVVNEPGESSGVFRIPDVNSKARNYYLIVEPVDAMSRLVAVDVVNEEDGKRYQVKRFGLRVPEAVFQAVAADKQDDGIIQNNIVGRKEAMRLEPDYLIETSGGVITEW